MGRERAKGRGIQEPDFGGSPDVLDGGLGGDRTQGCLPHIQLQCLGPWREQSRSCSQGVEDGDVSGVGRGGLRLQCL